MRKFTLKLLLVCMALSFWGCNDSDDGNYVNPITIYEKINGSWSLMNLKMVDEFAKSNAIKPDEQNLSTLFNYDTFQINFNVDGNMNPTTYEVIGDVPPLFEPSGFWSLSDLFQQTNGTPLLIHLFKDESRVEKTDDLKVISVPGSNREMQVQLVRVADGVAFVSYTFNLTANN
ncbi:DUF5004 domain-containing protein [Formosa haliotis]|uniref:DUF5004 domain-containing protein n=1 Tax=Formosa haliotis TaxID=1555194 RepID=UPI0008251323|nr:DUF5004 domain-containing protein [Formosa haliotis]